LAGTSNVKKTKEKHSLMAFLKWKHCYRDIWKVSSWFHRQHSSKYALLQSRTWSWESVGCFFMSWVLFCLY